MLEIFHVFAFFPYFFQLTCANVTHHLHEDKDARVNNHELFLVFDDTRLSIIYMFECPDTLVTLFIH